MSHLLDFALERIARRAAWAAAVDALGLRDSVFLAPETSARLRACIERGVDEGLDAARTGPNLTAESGRAPC